MNADVVFEEPPPDPGSQRHPYGLAERIAKVRERPGEWARVYGPETKPRVRVTASRIRCGNVTGIDPDEFEMRVGEQGDDWFVWMRYLGNGSAS